MKVYAWNNGSPNNKSGTGYGIEISEKDRGKYFDESWTKVVINFNDGNSTNVRISKSFWKDCIELRSQKIGKYLIENGIAPWDKGKRPSLSLELVDENRFRLATGRWNERKALQLVNWITERAIDGIPPLSSAEDLANEYLIDLSYPNDEERIESLINWETTKNFTSGFVTGLGGFITLPVSIPAAFGASWVIQARMAAAIAKIAGHDIHSDRVKTFVLVCLVGDAMKDIVKDAGINIARGFTKTAVKRIPGRLLIEINKKVGFRLLTKTGEKGVINVSKVVPILSGPVAGSFDAYMCRLVGKTAKDIFYNNS
ncbi:MAG: hypothetical protein RIG61_04570 [Deltaproteobacteria bacterium]